MNITYSGVYVRGEKITYHSGVEPALLAKIGKAYLEFNRRWDQLGKDACYKSGRGLVPLRWVFVHDRDGTHRDEYFFCTDPALTAKAIISHYTAR